MVIKLMIIEGVFVEFFVGGVIGISVLRVILGLLKYLLLLTIVNLRDWLTRWWDAVVYGQSLVIQWLTGRRHAIIVDFVEQNIIVRIAIVGYQNTAVLVAGKFYFVDIDFVNRSNNSLIMDLNQSFMRVDGCSGNFGMYISEV